MQLLPIKYTCISQAAVACNERCRDQKCLPQIDARGYAKVLMRLQADQAVGKPQWRSGQGHAVVSLQQLPGAALPQRMWSGQDPGAGSA